MKYLKLFEDKFEEEWDFEETQPEHIPLPGMPSILARFLRKKGLLNEYVDKFIRDEKFRNIKDCI